MQRLVCCTCVGANVQQGPVKGPLYLLAWRWQVLFDQLHWGCHFHITRDSNMGLCVPYLIMSETVCAVSWKVRWLQKSITARTCLVAVSVLGWNFRVRHFMYALKPASGGAVFIGKLKVAQTLAVLPTQVHCIGLQRSPMGPILRLLNIAQTFAASFKLKFNSTILYTCIFPK